MELSQSQIIKLQNLHEKGPGTSVSYTGFWKRFYDEYAIGSLARKTIKLSYKDQVELKQFLVSKGIDDKAFATPFKNRMEASLYGDEKLTKEAVTSGFVMVMGINMPISVDSGEIPKGYALTLTVAEACNIEIGTVVFVENLEVFLKLCSFPVFLDLFKDETNSVVALYRGGKPPMSAKGSKAFLRDFKGVVIGFCDFDPAGINQIGVSSCHSLILPSIPSDIDGLSKLSKSGAFLAQVSNKKGLQSIASSSPSLKPYIDLMLSSELAVMSEHLLSHESALSIVLLV